MKKAAPVFFVIPLGAAVIPLDFVSAEPEKAAFQPAAAETPKDEIIKTR